MAGITLRSFQFRREREATWRELDLMVAEVERRSLRALSADQLLRLPMLYRATLSSLSVARSISLDRNLLDYLESLSKRAYFCVYGTRTGAHDAAWQFLSRRFPQLMRRARWHVAMAALFVLLGMATGWLMTAGEPDLFYSFVPETVAQDRGPASTTAALRAVLYSGGDDAGTALHTFASFLFTNNARIGILAFALGFALGVPTLFLLFTNGLTLGAFAALYQSRGLSIEFWAWVLPHGITELLAVVLCGGAGLLLADAIVFPGRHTRLETLAIRGRSAAALVIGAVALFFVAALIEGLFRQLVHSVPLRYAVAAASAALWIGYFTLWGRGRADDTDRHR